MAEGLFENRNKNPSINSDVDCDEEVVLSKVVNPDDRKGRRMREKERQQKQKVLVPFEFFTSLEIFSLFLK